MTVVEFPNPAQTRWVATITYRTAIGTAFVGHGIEELSEIETIVERGPDWNAIVDIRIVLRESRRTSNATVEQADAQ